MTVQQFQASRPDGRSDIRVVIDLVAEHTPGTTFTYDDLQGKLQSDTDRVFTRQMIGSAVHRANRLLLARHQRVLHCVANIGYRLALANEHTALATQRETRADRQIRAAMSTLRNVRWDELSESERTIHQAHLQITGSLVQIARYVHNRQKSMDNVIDDLLRRVGTLEAR